MHFVGEACYRRPLEPRALTYSRGGTAVTMGLLFLAFCGYLINLIQKDTPLIQLSQETMETDVETPDIEICSQNSTLTFVRCDAMSFDWVTSAIPNCYEDYIRLGEGESVSKCYMFETRNRYRMALTGMKEVGKNAVRRFDIYWRADSIQNISFATIAIPAITVQLYHPSFNSWNKETIGDTEMEQKTNLNIQLGTSRSTSFMNHTSNIFYRPQKYRAIRPADAGTVLGIKSKFIDIMTLTNFQHNWPLQSDPPPPPPALDKSLYHGIFSVQLAQGTIDVKTEVRQHTVLASIALAGGCYGVLTTIYILLFGMTRLTPWGLVHHIPVFISKHSHHNGKDSQQETMFKNNFNHRRRSDEENNNGTTKKKKNFSDKLIPWFFRSRLKKSDESITSADVKEVIMTKMICRSKMQEQEQVGGKLSRVDSTELQLLDPTRPEFTTHASSCTNIDDGYDKTLKKLSTQQTGDSAEIFYQPPLSTFPPSLPPHANIAGSSRGDETIAASNDALRREQIKTSLLEARTTELSNRVEELEIILSEYFINTAYLDQLRVRRNATIAPSDLPETLR